MSKKNRIRIYLDMPLKIGEFLACPEKQMHYLIHVMRLQNGDEVCVFNGVDGEFKTIISEVAKKSCQLKIVEKIYDFESGPDVWLLFSPLKKDNTDLVVEKAVELGVAKICPIMTEYTSNSKVRPERLLNQMIEAAEQCRRQDIPELMSEQNLPKLLETWPQERKLIYLDETGKGKFLKQTFSQCSTPAALLVGPEGGFSEKELEILRSLPYTYGISLGRRILRAETAAIAALACWQAWCGDWQ